MAIKRVGASQGRFCDRIFFDSSLQILTSVIGGGARQGSHTVLRYVDTSPCLNGSFCATRQLDKTCGPDKTAA